MATLIIGKTGQLARALAKRRPGAIALGRDELDLAKPIRDLPEADGVILAAAYTDVDKAESEPELAERINGRAVDEIANICATRQIPFVHVSTDYVFSGEQSRAWRPEDMTKPLNAYGRSKLSGERAIARSGANAAILRTSWVFDATGNNFVTTMLRLAESRKRLSVVDDQIGRPTYAGHLADACLAALHGLGFGKSAGLYHVSNNGVPVSWAGFAKAIFAALNIETEVAPIPASDYPTLAPRPKWSVMDVSDFETTFGYELPDWREGLATALAERMPIRGSR